MTHPISGIAADLQIVVEELQEKRECKEKAEEKSKEKALSAARAKLINNAGDDFMYEPAGSFSAPTLTGGRNSIVFVFRASLSFW